MTLIKKKSKVRKSTKTKRPERGKELFNYVVQLTGLPKDKIKEELKTLLHKKNIEVSQLTVDQLRTVAASYLREIMAGIIERIPHKPRGMDH